ncbi:2-amino-4-hydroxy-6-hydroxymethyldihydropteridine diphosphokinase [Rudanella paleaurantiibacter]|uniref:2-amino-4-hydroxy-6-hydroxymethyldihydropteridine pyrophosphokinase n=1 Tax=Rudanella paleaurantiibacter TaxID=2614655 RepID=A0A7J5TWJ9_9BACT|nr:2-amino-4-hydroxy-6-hydroxymethyldihydropteridine diphosphokinase [Rudanella paleaurantiibacter]KAB7729019.1 2-amino-4-hydroxy-6-hydroxymethyldihydropteridine diphosphokinase [Rudanella paleaurantiibacter]
MRLFLLLGANLGDRVQMLTQAQTRLVQSVGPLLGASGLYETAPWGVTDQPAYLNQVLELDTQLAPADVLTQTQAIEQALGRVRLQRWGARIIDIDLLYYADTVLQTDRLTLPHPLLHERRFTLVPLCELAPDFVHPVLGQTNAHLLQQCPDTGEVNRFVG